MITLYGTSAGTNKLVRLNDETVTTDEGAAMIQPYFAPAPFDLGPAGGRGRVRRIAQAVALTADCAVEVTPTADGSESSTQAETQTKVAADGAVQIIETFPALDGTRFAFVARVTSVAGRPEFGECDVVMVPRRTTTNG